jgi:hypothetical protein
VEGEIMTCEAFRSRFVPAADDAGLLGHLRSCESCLAFAAESDPDVLFRSLGGDDLVPPGGIDAFVGDVMREVHLRSTERTVSAHGHRGLWRRLAVAAALATTLFATLLYQRERSMPSTPDVIATAAGPVVVQTSARPVIERYDSDNATIVEVPTEGVEDVKLVMIFDETLPADL